MTDQAPLFQGNGPIMLRTRDLDRLSAFYAACGFEEAARFPTMVIFRTGGDFGIEIAKLDESAPDRPVPEKRTQAHMIGMLKVRDVDEAIETVRAAGATILEGAQIGNSKLGYMQDPDGNIIGFATFNRGA
jgi:catechol 2,3-dioxygenase-like lactoylglutathione lyase family enzyme